MTLDGKLSLRGMTYIELTCNTPEMPEMGEVLIALLGDEGFEMFEEFEGGIKAYIQTGAFDHQILERLTSGEFVLNTPIPCEAVEVPDRNWNEVWESNFQPVIVGQKLLVRAEYHNPDPSIPFELIVQPRMAFGTGHHATTFQMMEWMLKMDFTGLQVMDMGCGTGILAILASKLGASKVLAVDFDPNSVENTAVNCLANDVHNVVSMEGTMQTVDDSTYDFVLANINRNIILSDLPLYKKSMKPDALLFTSGYYIDELPMIEEKASEQGLVLVNHSVMDKWCCALFKCVSRKNKD
ncbi:MAG: ribosomal protein methyltransferase [Bacteroidota bacterium]